MRGFTLPIWVVAAAKAAGQVLVGNDFESNQTIDFSDDTQSIVVPIRSAALLENGGKAIGISHCNSGKCLDITRGLEVWACLEFLKIEKSTSDLVLPVDKSWLEIVPGYGVGKLSATQEISISEFARQLLYYNLRSFRKSGYFLRVEIIFPSGKQLAEKTSNHAFGVVDGLALIGMQVEVQSSASPDQLQKTIQGLREKCKEPDFSGKLIFVIGENGLNLALNSGLTSRQIIKTGNWVGPLLVTAAELGVKQILLFGYHGKLIKLAGGVFHTHHHLADNRFETLIALAVKEGIPLHLIKDFENSSSIETALLILENQDMPSAKRLWKRLSVEVEKRSIEYVSRYFTSSIEIGAVLFDRRRKLRWSGEYGQSIMDSLGLKLED